MANILDNLKKNIPVSLKPKAYSFQTLQSQFDKAVSDFYSMLESPRFSMMSFEDLALSPSVDIVEDDKSFKVECEMPGLDEEDIHVSLKEGLLIIKGEKETSTKDKDKNYLLREINYGSYERTILLPENVDVDSAKASFKKGMLWVVIPKLMNIKAETRELKIEKAAEGKKGKTLDINKK